MSPKILISNTWCRALAILVWLSRSRSGMVHAGRLLLSLLHVPLRHDMYVAAAGCYALWAMARLVGWAYSVAMSPSIPGASRKLATVTDIDYLQQTRTQWLHIVVSYCCNLLPTLCTTEEAWVQPGNTATQGFHSAVAGGNDVTACAGVLQKLGRGIWTCVSAVMLIVSALGLLSLMTGVLADLVLAPFR